MTDVAVGQGRRLWLIAKLGEPTAPDALAFFRFALGMLVAVSALRFLAHGWVNELFVAPRFFFKYPGFAWVPALPPPCAAPIFVAMVVLGVMVAVGLFYRVAVALLFFVFAWVQLVDATNYLNHYVLVALLLGLIALLPLGRAHAVDAWIRPAKRLATFPAWMTWLLRFQVACVYVFAGKAKLGTDWLLHAQPLGIWLGSRTDTPIVGSLFAEPWFPYIFSWGGFFFDSTVVAFLSMRRTRLVAYVVLVGFHAVTMALFPIGMFPVIMVLTATIFFPPDWPRAVARWVARRPPRVLDPGDASRPLPPSAPALPPSRLVLGAGLAYALVNLTVPLRMHLYGGDVLWHEQGMRLAWKVMVREKNASVTYHLEDRQTGRRWFRRPRELLDARQEREFGTQPDLVLQLAHAFAADERERGRDVSVRVEALASLNGRAARLLVDPEVDLTEIRPTLGSVLRPASWILPGPTEPPPHREPRRRVAVRPTP